VILILKKGGKFKIFIFKKVAHMGRRMTQKANKNKKNHESRISC
jgi:hypothetical protein